MNYWLLKSDPESYSFDDLERDGRTRWDGATNPQALGFLRQMAAGDLALVYHSGKEKAIVGSATIDSAPYGDPASKDGKLVVVDLRFSQRAAQPVTLARIKADPAFAEFHLVRQSRLSVIPVPQTLWTKLAAWCGLKSPK